MKADFEDIRMQDGSRLFATLPASQPGNRLRDYLATLHGATVTGFLSDNVTEIWIDFEFEDERFTVNNQFSEYWFFVGDPSCDDQKLKRVVEHCVQFLGR